jgi:hypothetical protein
MGGVVVHDQVQLHPRVCAGDLLEELEELVAFASSTRTKARILSGPAERESATRHAHRLLVLDDGWAVGCRGP